MKSFLKTFVAVLLANMLLVVLLIGIVAGRMKKPVEVPDGSVLWQTIEGEIPEYEPIGGLPGTGGDVQSHAAIMENLEKARSDRRIRAVLLRVGNPGLNLAMMDELRERIGKLRGAGKPVYAYTDMLQRRGLYLASACDSLFLLPNGYVSLHGHASERMFLAGTLEKLGIKENLHRIEGYKAFAEIFQRTDISPRARANAEWILDVLYPAYLQTVEEGRRLAAGTLESTVFAAGAMGPSRAKELGLVDRLAYRDEIEAALLRIPGVKADGKAKKLDPKAPPLPRLIGGREYARVERAQAGIKGKKTIAVVHAAGNIQGEESGFSFPFGHTMGSATMEDAFRQAAANKDVAGILYRVDSGGGESHTSWRIQRAALRARERKPMVVSMGDLAGSGGYLICYPCEPILAGRLSVVGSIGSISGKFDLRGLYDKLGVTKDFITRGPFAKIESEYTSYSPEEWAAFTREHWEEYNVWVSDIARVRGRTFAEIDSAGRGRVWTGEQALERGLIDRIGGHDAALALLKEKAGIPASEEVKLVHYPKKKGTLESLRHGGWAAAIVALADDLTRSLRQPATWAVDWNDYR
jgi:protease-4